MEESLALEPGMRAGHKLMMMRLTSSTLAHAVIPSSLQAFNAKTWGQDPLHSQGFLWHFAAKLTFLYHFKQTYITVLTLEIWEATKLVLLLLLLLLSAAGLLMHHLLRCCTRNDHWPMT